MRDETPATALPLLAELPDCAKLLRPAALFVQGSVGGWGSNDRQCYRINQIFFKIQVLDSTLERKCHPAAAQECIWRYGRAKRVQ